ncbi:MAG: YbaK/EbsC family protein [Patescibacteria group bacterium]|nr:YbaK/EbsC family protein [Patescibacteria group bacterium]
MAIPKKILNYLEKNKVKFEKIVHRTVYTAYDLAQTLREKINKIAKTLVIKTEKGYAILVLPASRLADLKKLKKALKAKKVEIAKEGVMKTFFKIKPGTITPFASLHKRVPLYLDKALLKTKEMIINAGSYTDSLRLKVKDFLKLEKPTQGNFSKKK